MDDRLKPRDWGKGIPKYKESEIMTKEEVHDFGCEIVARTLDKDGYKILEYNPRYGSYPSIVAKNDKEVVAVAVKTDIAPKMPEFDFSERSGIIGFCDGFETKPCIAAVGIGSTDGERFNKGLALIGDGYYANFKGLEYLSKELPKVGTEKYEAYVMQVIGGYLRANNYDVVKEYILDNCKIDNEISDKKIEDNVIKYFKKIFSEQPIIGHCIIKSVGNFKTVEAAGVIIKGEKKEGPSTIKVMQEPNKIGLLLITKDSLFNNGDNGLVLSPKFDKNGKIESIKMIDPRLYGFEAYK
ncbi:MAG: hypothetical protein IKX00_03915 [Bacilli bacterium]|nr:hypothetical protein [Bacilli bacterium]